MLSGPTCEYPNSKAPKNSLQLLTIASFMKQLLELSGILTCLLNEYPNLQTDKGPVMLSIRNKMFIERISKAITLNNEKWDYEIILVKHFNSWFSSSPFKCQVSCRSLFTTY